MAPGRHKNPTIIITTGDAFGIGPEITHLSLDKKSIRKKAKFIVIGDLKPRKAKNPGPSKLAGNLSYTNLKKAVVLLSAIKGPKALVTGPICKKSIAMAGLGFGGQTEILKKLTRSNFVAMMFSSSKIKLVLCTRHIPLKKAAASINSSLIVRTTRLFYSCLKEGFKIKNPLICLCGLNPHAGEKGLLGNEEKILITPALKKIKKFARCLPEIKPADTVFNEAENKNIHGIVSMYHDQCLPVFKTLFLNEGVNITLGLPFIRTSPDHGTAFDIAGKRKANPGSMESAIETAIELAR